MNVFWCVSLFIGCSGIDAEMEQSMAAHNVLPSPPSAGEHLLLLCQIHVCGTVLFLTALVFQVIL